ncbi:four helix bundle protein [uncultured Microscilla sp.]|uniref:four helix bundle protein n=1 Tax=uncultured Microscilla sp. TaxID=432653 RepID=UPI002623D14D|nr:four helix bundle protein [uncultured Microscilla sp.]
MRNFRNLDIWKKSMNLVTNIYKTTATLPDTEKFGLISQMQRCAVSIPSNIAEGCSRSSEKEYKRFLEIAQGSSFELETQLLICKAVNHLTSEKVEVLVDEVHQVQRQINGLISTIKTSLRKKR